MYQIQNIQIDELKEAEYNPRNASKKEVSDLKQSIKRFGLVDPIIVNSAKNRKNIIIGGHFRVHVAKDLGFKEIPAIYIDISDIKKEQELNLRLNKNLGNWDYDLLANLDEDLLKDVGFENKELENVFQLEAKEDDFDAEEEAGKIKKPRSKLGEIYKLGNHRLMCGDATKKEDVDKLMVSKKARMLFTDPPYNVNYAEYNLVRNGGKDWRDSYCKETKDKLSKEDYKNFIEKFIKNSKIFLIAEAQYYIWFAIKYYSVIIEIFEKLNIKYDPVPIIWKKEHFTISWSRYHRNYEACLFAGGGIYTNGKNKVSWFGKNNEVSLWEIDRDITGNYIHPTQKPIALASRAIKNSSQEKDIILDLFGGSGSTLIACEQLNRKCFMMELEPIYCDVIINRYERYINAN